MSHVKDTLTEDKEGVFDHTHITHHRSYRVPTNGTYLILGDLPGPTGDTRSG